MEIGIISDTHNRLPDNIEELLQGVEQILHAGDIGQYHIIRKLSAIAPLHAIYGNTDLYTVASILSAQLRIRLEGLDILIKHDIGDLQHFSYKLQQPGAGEKPDMVVFGHTHRPVFQKINDIYFVNPGSASKPRGGIPCSLRRLKLSNGKIIDQRLIKI